MEKTSADLYNLCKNDFKSFMEAIIGLKNEKFHNELDDNISDTLHRKIVISASRGHGKSAHISIGFPLWLIARNHNLRILIISSTAQVSKSFLSEVVGHIDRNEEYKLFSKFVDPMQIGVIPRVKNWAKMREHWASDSIVIDRDQLNLKDPTINAIGLFGSILSKRADVILCDDIVTQENSATETQRKKVIDWIYTTIMPVLVPGGTFIYLGNTWHCFPGYTRIEKENGSSPISLIKIGDKVRTHTGNYKKVSKVMCRIDRRPNNRINIKTRYQEIRCTPEHPFLVNGHFIKANDLKKGDNLFYPIRKGKKWKIEFDNSHSKNKLDNFICDKDFAFFMGMYIGDGWIGGNKRVEIILNKKQLEDKSRIIKIAKRFKRFVIKKGTSEKTIIISIYSTSLVRFIENNCGRLCLGKKIPQYIFEVDDDIKSSFILGMFNSDGCYNASGGMIYTSVNNKLVIDLKNLLITLNISTIDIKERINKPNSYCKNPLPNFRLGIGKYEVGKIKSIESGDYKIISTKRGWSPRKVYNLEVEDDNSYIANGFSVHNCDDLVSRLMHDPQFDYKKKMPAIMSESSHPELWERWAQFMLDESVEVAERRMRAEEWYRGHQKEMDEGVKVLWSSRFPYSDLYLMRLANPYAFARMYQCNPQDRPDQRFKDAWLEAACKKGKALKLQHERRENFEMEVITEGVDLAISEESGSDDTAILILDKVKYSKVEGIKTGDIIVRDIDRGKFSPNTVKDKIKHDHENVKPDGIRVETVGYQEAIQRDLDDAGVPVRGYKTGGEKKDPFIGINSIAIYAELGKLVLPFDNTDPRTINLISQLVNEMRAFPDGHTGDSLMALWFAFSEMRDLSGDKIVVPNAPSNPLLKDPPNLADPAVRKPLEKKADLDEMFKQEEREFLAKAMGGMGGIGWAPPPL